MEDPTRNDIEVGSSSSGSFSFSLGSSTSTTNSLTGVRNKAMDAMRFMSFQTQRRRLPFKSIVIVTLAIDFLQMSSLIFDPSLFYHDEASRSVPFNDAPIPLRILRIFRYCRATFQLFMGVYIPSCLICISFPAILFVQGLLIYRGNLGIRIGFYFLKWVHSIGPVLSPLMLNCFLQTYFLNTQGSNVVVICLATLGMVCLFVSYFDCCAFCFDFRPAWGTTAVSKSSFLYIQAIIRVLLVVSDVLVNGNASPTTKPALITIHAGLCLALFTILDIALVYLQPYFKSVVNHITAVIFTGLFFSSIFAFASTLLPVSVTPYLLIAAIVSFVPSGFIGVVLCNLRMRLVKRKTQSYLLATENTEPVPILQTAGSPIEESNQLQAQQNSNSNHHSSHSSQVPLQFKSMFKSQTEVDLSTRFIYNSRSPPTQNEIENAKKLFQAAVQIFPSNAFVHALFATFYIEVCHDAIEMKRELVKAHALKPRWDLDYQLYCLLMSVNGKDSSQDEVDIDLLLAKLHHSAAKKSMTDFWARVSRAKVLDIEALLSSVNAIDHHETLAEEIFKRLLSDNERSIPILRAYALFLIDVKDDKEQADMLVQLADDIEDQQAKLRKKHNTGNRHQISLPTKDPNVRFDAPTVVVVEMAQETPDLSMITPVPQRDGISPSQMSESNVDTHSECTIDSSASTTKLSDTRGRLLQYRARIMSSRSTAVSKLLLAVIVSLFLLFSLSAAIVGISIITANDMSNSIAVLHATQQVEHNIVNSLLKLRLFMIDGNDSMFTTIEDINVTFTELQENFEILERSSETWSSLGNLLQLRKYFPGLILNASKGDRVIGNATFNDAIETSVALMRNLEGLVLSKTPNLESRPDFRYLMDNLVDPIIPAFQCWINEQSGKIQGDQSFVTISLSISFPLVFVICTLSFLFLFIPSMRQISSERKAAVSLFGAIPKSSCINLHQTMQAEMEKIGEKYKSGKVAISSTSGSIVKRVYTYYTAFMVVMFSLGVCALLMLLISTNRGVSSGDISSVNSKRHQAMVNMAFLTNEQSMNDWATWTDERILSLFKAAFEALNDANNELKLELKEGASSNHIYDLLYRDKCPEPLHCNGLIELMEIFAASASSYVFNTLDKTRNSSFFVFTMTSYRTANKWLNVRLEDDASVQLAIPQSLQVFACIALVLGALLLICSYLMFRPLLRGLEIETTKCFLLLLRLPLNVLLGVDEIKAYLENGFTTVQDSCNQVAEEQDARTKKILDGSKDAVIIVDESLKIALFNPAAERMLDYPCEDVLGKTVLQLMETETGKLFQSATEEFIHGYQQKKSKKKKPRNKKSIGNSRASSASVSEVEMRQRKKSQTGEFSFGEDTGANLQMIRQDGVAIPVLISAVSVHTCDGLSFACFVKDISSMKKHEQELQRERRRADVLLKNILPEAIADQLKHNPGHTVAEKYESVTVLFADIVEFTPKAAGMSPEKLVEMLNGLFSLWDNLCIEHGIEKVKTIGDCFMAACGVPVRCKNHAERMADFSLAMLADLEEYNKSRTNQPELQVRVGINTGPVVAGVIGKTKLQYDLWGDAVNVAARVESTGLPNRVQVSQSTHDLIADKYQFESRGKIALKGKGEQECFLLSQNSRLRHASSFALSQLDDGTTGVLAEMFGNTSQVEQKKP